LAEQQPQPAQRPAPDPHGLHVRHRVERCLICGHTSIGATTHGRFVTTSCADCRAVLQIEFDPPDQPGLRARIERLDDPD